MSIKGIYDIHCHIVPGVDDGATDIGETVKLLRMEYEQGVRTVIATPHFRFRMFETPAEKVREQFRLVEKAASEISPDLHVYLGCEFHANMEMLVEISSGVIENDRVQILAGPLMGMEGNIRRIDRHKRTAYLEIEMFGRTVEMKVGLEIIRKE